MPTSWQTRSCIRRRHPACGRRVRPERRCACGTEWSRCHRQALPEVCLGYVRWGWRREQASCGQAHIEPENQSIQANLICHNQYNRHNSYKRYNHYDIKIIYIKCIMYINHIICIINLITILRIVVWLQRRHERTIKGLGSGVGSSRCSEKEQNPSIPHSIWRHNEASIIDTRRPNHDETQAMTAMKLFSWKRIAVYPLDTFILGNSWYDQAPNNGTVQSDPCVLQSPAIPMSPREQ